MIPSFIELTTETRMTHRTIVLREGLVRELEIQSGGKGEIGENPKMF